MYDPRYELIKLKESQYIYSGNNPPSPKTHGLNNLVSYQQNNYVQNNAYHINAPLRQENQRNSAGVRPSSHNPFTYSSKSNEKQPLKV